MQSFHYPQYGKSVGGAGTPSSAEQGEEARFHHDIDINDVRNRYLLTKGATQDEVHRFSSCLRLPYIC